MAGYSGKPLRDKLGIKDGIAALVVGAPDSYLAEVGLRTQNTAKRGAKYAFIHAFARDRAELRAHLRALKPKLNRDGMMWISWPKKSAKLTTDLDENVVRELGLAAGLVDVKVAAIDQTWSGLKFVYRLRDR